MYWLYLDLSDLALYIDTPEPSAQPLVIIEQQKITHANQSAKMLGVHSGQSLSVALQLAPSLKIATFDSNKITQKLQQLATKLLELTPKVCVISNDGLLVCSEGMEPIYPTIQQHLRALLTTIRQQQIPVDGVAALSAPLAIWLARQRHNQKDLPRILLRVDQCALALAYSELPEEMVTELADMGLNTLSELLKLPRAQLRARFGQLLLDYLDQCLGKHPVTYQWQKPIAQFTRKTILNYEATQSSQLSHSIRQLVHALAHYLRVNQLACQRLTLQLHYRQRPAETLTIDSVQLQHQAEAWQTLIDLQLDYLQLPEPVIAITLKSGPCQALQSHWYDLWHNEYSHADATLLDKLSQRLGQENIFYLNHHDTHLPEQATTLTALNSPDNPAEPPLKLPQRPRPLWLLAAPQPISADAFICLDKPELVELEQSGIRIIRSYQRVVFNHSRAQGWAFYDPHATPAGWWLHGWFA
ncbi:Y-family DNA polymerase [Celerinatantimonas sp. MCCC 1A17872]|uniref:Y-family DNA polymerase n=1 Tax=Celerinatantimonas sp. MCCC 1A17872 TaxID=3177514 RepID=UPI0038C94911